jgi:hypothetical protein
LPLSQVKDKAKLAIESYEASIARKMKASTRNNNGPFSLRQ